MTGPVEPAQVVLSGAELRSVVSRLAAEISAAHPGGVDETARRLVPVPLRFVGSEGPDRFLFGYGPDFAGRYRNLDLVAAAGAQALSAEPDLHQA